MKTVLGPVYICVWVSTLARNLEAATDKKCDLKPEGVSNMTWLQYMIPKLYNPKAPPVYEAIILHAKTMLPVVGCPVEVKIVIAPWGIGEISIENMHVEVNLYVYVTWEDHRLNIPKDLNSIVMPKSMSSALWIPELAFRNCMSCSFLRFDPDADILMINGKKLIFFLRRTPKIFCDFDISNYPMDRHSCSIEVQSPNDWRKSVLLVDDCKKHRFFRNASVPQFIVENHSSGVCTSADESATYASCIEYRMTFVRQVAYHLMITYAPSSLIVFLTWISFWLDITLCAPRVALGLTSLLTLTTQFANAQKNLPPVSYLKAIDVWMVMCIFLVFSSLVEFAIAYSLMQNTKAINGTFIQLRGQEILVNKGHRPRKKINIDKIARIIFPITFFVFNICYWSYYCSR